MEDKEWDEMLKRLEETTKKLSSFRSTLNYLNGKSNDNSKSTLEKEVEESVEKQEQPVTDKKYLDFKCSGQMGPLFEFLDDLPYLIKKGYKLVKEKSVPYLSNKIDSVNSYFSNVSNNLSKKKQEYVSEKTASFNSKKQSVKSAISRMAAPVKSFINVLGEKEELFANSIRDSVLESGPVLVYGLKSSRDDLNKALSYLSEYTYYGTAYLNLGCELGLSNLKDAVINFPDNARNEIKTYEANQKFLSAPAHFANEIPKNKPEVPVIQKFKNMFAEIKSDYKSKQKFLSTPAYFASDKKN